MPPGVVVAEAGDTVAHPLVEELISVPVRYHTITVWREYDRHRGHYEWTVDVPDGTLVGWPDILDYAARRNWDLLSCSVESYLEGNTSMEATGYRLFFREPG